MDGRARLALEDLVRRVVCGDLDRLTSEVEELSEQMLSVSRLLGLAGQPLAVRERRRAAAEMRRQGLSTRAIASALRSHRNTIVTDLRAMGAEPPAGEVTGLDGRLTRPQIRPPG